MPSLKDLNCFIEPSTSGQKLQEFGTSYRDGLVETFVAVPSAPQPFAVRLTSSNFIAPGLAMYVFIDGKYQCNRNRQDLKLRKPPDRRSLVDFCVRQKEEKQKDGSMIARDWKFEKLNTTSANDAPKTYSSNILENIGCIEVVVLRCAGPRSAISASTTKQAAEAGRYKSMNLDGACDVPDHPFGLDGQSQDWEGYTSRPHYDDRGWQHLRGPGHPSIRPGAPAQSFASGYGPPPPLSPRSHHARTLNNRNGTFTGSQHAVSGRGGHYNGPPLGYSYGTGPIPHQPTATLGPTPAPTVISPNTQAIDPQQLDQLLTDAVKKGVAAYHSNGAASQTMGEGSIRAADAQQAPGAWPLSPFGLSATPHQTEHSNVSVAAPIGNFSTASVPQGAAWGHQSAPTHVNNHVGWDQPARSVAPTRASYNGGWGSPDDKAESWDTDNTWNTNLRETGWTSSENRRGPFGGTSAWGDATPRAVSPTTRSTRTGNWNRSFDNHTVRSRPRESVWESKEDKDGWTHIDAASDTDSSWGSTVRPQSSISAFIPSGPAAPTIRSYKTGAETFQTDHGGVAPAIPAPSLDMSAPHEIRTSRANAAHVIPAPYGITFDEFLQKTDKNKDGRGGWGNDSSGAKQASWDTGNDNTWGAANDTANVTRGGTSKEIATLEDGWNEYTGWRNTGSKDEQDNAWGIKDAINKLGEWFNEDTNNAQDKNSGWSAAKDAWGKQAETEDAGIKGNERNSDKKGTTNPWLAQEPTASKLYNPKSRLSKYRQLRDAPADTSPKKHWQFPPPHSDKKLQPVPEGHGTIPEEPLHSMSKQQAEEKGVEHQVRAGKGTKYGHNIGRPEYVDSLDKPYAVFRFKYRSRDLLKRMFGDAVPDHEPKPTEAVKEKLKGLPHDALVDSLLKLQNKLAEKERRVAKSPRTEDVGRDRTKDWVKEHSREASEKGKAEKNRRKRTSREKSGWEATWGKEEKKENEGGSGWGRNGWN